ncbi:hypothetical protein PYCC9005_000979 [Savitreella phatthalungensis]
MEHVFHSPRRRTSMKRERTHRKAPAALPLSHTSSDVVLFIAGFTATTLSIGAAVFFGLGALPSNLVESMTTRDNLAFATVILSGVAALSSVVVTVIAGRGRVSRSATCSRALIVTVGAAISIAAQLVTASLLGIDLLRAQSAERSWDGRHFCKGLDDTQRCAQVTLLTGFLLWCVCGIVQAALLVLASRALRSTEEPPRMRCSLASKYNTPDQRKVSSQQAVAPQWSPAILELQQPTPETLVQLPVNSATGASTTSPALSSKDDNPFRLEVELHRTSMAVGATTILPGPGAAKRQKVETRNAWSSTSIEKPSTSAGLTPRSSHAHRLSTQSPGLNRLQPPIKLGDPSMLPPSPSPLAIASRRPSPEQPQHAGWVEWGVALGSPSKQSIKSSRSQRLQHDLAQAQDEHDRHAKSVSITRLATSQSTASRGTIFTAITSATSHTALSTTGSIMSTKQHNKSTSTGFHLPTSSRDKMVTVVPSEEPAAGLAITNVQFEDAQPWLDCATGKTKSKNKPAPLKLLQLSPTKQRPSFASGASKSAQDLSCFQDNAEGSNRMTRAVSMHGLESRARSTSPRKLIGHAISNSLQLSPKKHAGPTFADFLDGRASKSSSHLLLPGTSTSSPKSTGRRKSSPTRAPWSPSKSVPMLRSATHQDVLRSSVVPIAMSRASDTGILMSEGSALAETNFADAWDTTTAKTTHDLLGGLVSDGPDSPATPHTAATSERDWRWEDQGAGPLTDDESPRDEAVYRSGINHRTSDLFGGVLDDYAAMSSIHTSTEPSPAKAHPLARHSMSPRKRLTRHDSVETALVIGHF